MIYLRSTPQAPHPTTPQSTTPLFLSTPAANCPAASLRLQSPSAHILPISLQQPQIHQGCAQTHARMLASTNLTTLTHVYRCICCVCVCMCVRAVTLFTISFSHFPARPLLVNIQLQQWRQHLGNAKVRDWRSISYSLSLPLLAGLLWVLPVG